jgi:processing peptidase subunit alpha
VDSGSVYETPETTGASHLLEYLAFKSTTNRTSFRITRELEGLGANVVASASREQVLLEQLDSKGSFHTRQTA